MCTHRYTYTYVCMYIIISILARCTSPAKDTGNKGFDSSSFSGSSAVTNNERMTGLFAKGSPQNTQASSSKVQLQWTWKHRTWKLKLQTVPWKQDSKLLVALAPGFYRCEPGSFCGAANDLRIFDLKSGLRVKGKLPVNHQS